MVSSPPVSCRKAAGLPAALHIIAKHLLRLQPLPLKPSWSRYLHVHSSTRLPPLPEMHHFRPYTPMPLPSIPCLFHNYSETPRHPVLDPVRLCEQQLLRHSAGIQLLCCHSKFLRHTGPLPAGLSHILQLARLATNSNRPMLLHLHKLMPNLPQSQHPNQA